MDLADRVAQNLCRLSECPASGTMRQGVVSLSQNNNRLFTVNLVSTATWNPRSFLNLKTTVGTQYFNNENDGVSASGTILPPGGTQVGDATNKSGDNTYPTATKTLGLYAQEQFGIRDRLFLVAALRTDQNSAFGTNFQHVVYPKLSASWITSDEAWFPQFDVAQPVPASLGVRRVRRAARSNVGAGDVLGGHDQPGDRPTAAACAPTRWATRT